MVGSGVPVMHWAEGTIPCSAFQRQSKTSARCPAPALSTRPGIRLGPAALRALILLSAVHKSVGESVRG